MRLLVATTQTQGARQDDYCWTVDGELVRLPLFECDCGDECGCSRGFAGLASHRATTTAVVAERPEIDLAILAQLLADDTEAAGLSPLDEATQQWVLDEATKLSAVGNLLEIGTVVERHGTTIEVRWDPANAGDAEAAA